MADSREDSLMSRIDNACVNIETNLSNVQKMSTFILFMQMRIFCYRVHSGDSSQGSCADIQASHWRRNCNGDWGIELYLPSLFSSAWPLNKNYRWLNLADLFNCRSFISLGIQVTKTLIPDRETDRPKCQTMVFVIYNLSNVRKTANITACDKSQNIFLIWVSSHF